MSTKAEPGRRKSGRPGSGEAPLGIKVVDQALSLLETIASAANRQSLMELSRASGMEPSKLHRYLVSLCNSELVAKVETGLYELGPGAIRLGGQALRKIDAFVSAEGFLDELVDRLGESAFLYVWTVSGPVMIRTRKPEYSQVNLPIGTVVPLIGSASGPVFVAFLPWQQVSAVFARDAAAAGIDEKLAIEEVRDKAGPRIRADRVHVSDSTLLPNMRACAAPILNAQGELTYVIGVSMRHRGARLPDEEIRDTLRDLSLAMSRRLGSND